MEVYTVHAECRIVGGSANCRIICCWSDVGIRRTHIEFLSKITLLVCLNMFFKALLCEPVSVHFINLSCIGCVCPCVCCNVPIYCILFNYYLLIAVVEECLMNDRQSQLVAVGFLRLR